MLFLGGTPAAIVGVSAVLVGWLPERYPLRELLINGVTFAWFPLIGGISFFAMSKTMNVVPSDGSFYLVAFVALCVALACNIAMMMSYTGYVERKSPIVVAKRAIPPVLASELFSALLVLGIAYFYYRVGLPAVGLCAIVLISFQILLGQLLLSEERAEKLETRTKQLHGRTRQLASLQVGVLSALMHTLDLRDKMTARHCAAVARYAREIAVEAGCTKEEQDLVHTAGLLHDIGKFIFPDSILKGGAPLTEDDWNTIRMHPYQGAKIVSDVEGYGPVGEIILAHHERINGEGYPRGLEGDEIPKLSRMISVADTYDVMTARDSYREPVSSFEAIQELKRVSGEQLDAEYVEIFIRVLAGKDVRYRHGEDADFDAELNLQKRIDDYSFPAPGQSDEEIAVEEEEELVAAAAGNGSAPRRSFAARLVGRTPDESAVH
ncbi:MAG: HD domain-containing phosphohydrolase [Solirubrobacterales bacterium]